MNLKADIQEAMQEQKVTAYRLSKLIGCDRSLLSRYFNDKSAISLDVLISILDVLGYELTIRKKGNNN